MNIQDNHVDICIYLNKYVPREDTIHGGCSSVVERKLCMFEAPGSIPGVSTYFIYYVIM